MSRKHGMRNTPEYQAWVSMIARTSNERWRDYHRYGGRGIRVCGRWRESFEAFYVDVGPRPSPEHSLDRIDVDGHYEPGNVRWATRVEQGRNKRNNRLVTSGGETASLAEWAARVGLRPGTIRMRLERGWPVERALGLPAHAHAPAGCPEYPRAPAVRALTAALAALGGGG